MMTFKQIAVQYGNTRAHTHTHTHTHTWIGCQSHVESWRTHVCAHTQTVTQKRETRRERQTQRHSRKKIHKQRERERRKKTERQRDKRVPDRETSAYHKRQAAPLPTKRHTNTDL